MLDQLRARRDELHAQLWCALMRRDRRPAGVPIDWLAAELESTERRIHELMIENNSARYTRPTRGRGKRWPRNTQKN